MSVLFKAFEVFPFMFQGSQISTAEDLREVKDLKIRAVIDLEGGFDPPMDFLETYLYWPFSDAPWLPDLVTLSSVAAYGFSVVNQKDRLLVHCRQGLNRSGLVCARIMSFCGLKGPDILSAINEKIPLALWNPVFRCYVSGLNNEERG